MTPASHPAASPAKTSRIAIVDALRGAALSGILLLHSIEHWELAIYPENPPAWLKTANTWTHDTGFFLFGGKAYAIFAMMFGISFSLILESWSRRGYNFQGRFLWRLVLLAGFGYLNGIVYCGDVLLVIALLGMPLVFLYRLSTKALLWISALLLLQPPTLWFACRALFDAGYQFPKPLHWNLYGQLMPVFTGGSLVDFIKINLTTGQYTRLLWTYESGRYLQMLGLFIWGLLLGRSHLLEDLPRAVPAAKKALLCGAIGFALFYPLKLHLPHTSYSDLNRTAIDGVLYAYGNLSQLCMWVGIFVLAYQNLSLRRLLNVLAPFGRMSLTNYVVQGLIGVPLFYHFGFGLFRHLGMFFSVQIGFVLLATQIALSHYWLARFHYGPLEWLWRALTGRSFDIPFRKTAPAQSV
jgi:uncharacterized protein